MATTKAAPEAVAERPARGATTYRIYQISNPDGVESLAYVGAAGGLNSQAALKSFLTANVAEPDGSSYAVIPTRNFVTYTPKVQTTKRVVF